MTLDNHKFEIQLSSISNDRIEVKIVSDLLDIFDSDVIYTYSGTPSNFFNPQSYMIAVATVQAYVLARCISTDADLVARFSAEMVSNFFDSVAPVFTKSKSTTSEVKTIKAQPVSKSSAKSYRKTRKTAVKITDDIVAKIIDLYLNKGKNAVQIGKQLNVSPGTVSRYLRDNGYFKNSRVKSSTDTAPKSTTVQEAVRSLKAPS
jgi:predicted transcriptional regulator YheO